MKEWIRKYKKTSIFFITIFLAYLCYTIFLSYNTKQADKKINAFIQASGFNEKDIHVIEETKDTMKEPFSNLDRWYVKTITTIQDYEQWKKQVLATKKLMNQGNLDDPKFVDDRNHCEITYYFVYYPDKNKVFAYYGIAGKTYETKNKLPFQFANTLLNDKTTKE